MLKRFLSLLVIMTLLMTSTLANVTTSVVYAETPEKKEKFIIKHANNERLKEKFFPDEELPVDETTGTFNEVETLNNFEEVTENITAAEITATEIEELLADPEIYGVEHDSLVSISSDIFPENLIIIGEDQIDDLNFTGAGIKVAILDTGIDLENTDLNVAGGISFIDGTTYDDDHGHGTALASIIGAKANGEGFIGIAPDAELYAVKVLDQNGTGYYSDVMKGLEWCIDNRMDIILMSFGSSEYSGMLHEVIQSAHLQDALIIGAAGNNTSTVEYPAAYPEVMAVDAVDSNGVAMYQKTDLETIDIYAIGSGITTYDLTGQTLQNGTSFSAAHVAGVAAELWSNDLAKTNSMIREQLKVSSDQSSGVRILNAHQVYLDEIGEITVDPDDNLGDVDPETNPDAEVSVSAEIWKDGFVVEDNITVATGESISVGVKFSNSHDSVEANMEVDGVKYTDSVTSVVGGYENGEYTGDIYTFSFGAIETEGDYIISFSPYNDGVIEYPFTVTVTVTENGTPVLENPTFTYDSFIGNDQPIEINVDL